MDMNGKGTVFDIMKFAIHDGPGIRTAVFLKGCPLRCLWCHNPESQETKPELSFIPSKCIGCGYCFKACPDGCHRMEDGVHVLDRSKCVRCGLCAKECHAQALELIGREMGVDEVLDEVMKDQPFYETSGGGLTVSGGEPMAQFEFTLALLTEAKRRGLHVCMETCGFASRERYGKMLPLVDIFLFDVKESDDARHREYTGVPLEPIRKTLEFLDEKGAQIVLRCPLIPGLNAREEHFKAVGELAERLKNVSQVDVEPYHPLGISKSERIGKDAALAELKGFPEKEEAERWVASIKAHTSKPVAIS
jgi:pyruvate formate lyase activating enzyme